MRILVISKLFPPLNNAQALQSYKVAKALSQAGCDVRVVAELKGDKTEKPTCQFPVQYISSRKSDHSNFGTRFTNRLLESKLWCRWARRACDVCLEIIKDFRPDIILTISNPYHSHYVGLLLRQRTKICWIASFQDPCPSSILPLPYHWDRGTIRNLWEMHFARKVLNKCDAVLMTNFYALRLMEKKIGSKILNKSFALPHVGTEFKKKTDYTERYLAYIGDMAKRESPFLLEAIKQISSEMPEQFQGLFCVGSGHEKFQNMVREKNVEHLVNFMGQVPSSTADEIAANSYALLVIEADMPESPFLPSKFADYATIGHPIIAITSPVSPIRDYLRQYGGGIAVNHNKQEIIKAIRDVFSGSFSNCELSRNNNTEDLASLFSASTVAASYKKMFETLCRNDRKY